MRASETAVESRRIWVSVTQCAWCRGIRVWRWYLRWPKLPLLTWREQFRLPYLPVLVVSMTHGACPDCAQRVNESARRSRLRRRVSDVAAVSVVDREEVSA